MRKGAVLGRWGTGREEEGRGATVEGGPWGGRGK